jgi:cystathionine beta-synthase
MNLKVLDEVVRVDDKECFNMTRRLSREEGLFVGGSCGAAVAGAIKYAEGNDKGEKILILLPDGASKYLSKIFNDEWMKQNGFLEAPDALGTVQDLLRRRGDRKLVAVQKSDSIRKVIGMLKDGGFSQVPVMDGGRILGLVAESDLLKHLVTNEGKLDDTVEPLVESDYATVTPSTRIVLLKSVFNDAKLVVVQDRDDVTGIITKIDLIDYLADRRAA